MIDKKTIVGFLVSFSEGKKKTFSKQTLHPRREWFIGVSMFLLVLLCGGFFGVYTFLSLKDMQKNIVGTAVSIDEYRQNTAKQALELYGKKKQRFEYLQTLKQETSVVPKAVVDTVDPGIASSSPSVGTTTVSSVEIPVTVLLPAVLEPAVRATTSSEGI